MVQQMDSIGNGHRSGFVSSLAGTGQPGGGWAAWEEVGQNVMVLDVPESGGSRLRSRLRKEFCDYWDQVPDIYVPIT